MKTTECLGSCGTAPMLQCGADYYENLTNEKVDTLIEKWKSIKGLEDATKGWFLTVLQQNIEVFIPLCQMKYLKPI